MRGSDCCLSHFQEAIKIGYVLDTAIAKKSPYLDMSYHMCCHGLMALNKNRDKGKRASVFLLEFAKKKEEDNASRYYML